MMKKQQSQRDSKRKTIHDGALPTDIPGIRLAAHNYSLQISSLHIIEVPGVFLLRCSDLMNGGAAVSGFF
nr:hypothetical protein [Cronobacter dublinensis]